MIDPLTKKEFMGGMKAAKRADQYSENAVERFYRWMYSNQTGVVQTCAFPVPPSDKDKNDMGGGKWIHARTYNEFEEFCRTHSGLWRYHVYSGVNTLNNIPQTGRGSVREIETIKRLTFDIETSRSSYQGSSKEEVWWTYQYALAQIKYISEKFNAWPLVVMSENGIHLHYMVSFECSNDYLHNRQHIYSKYITKNAMNNKYVSIIESKAPDDIVFDQDDVSDPARVMKVPGTLGIKSKDGRLCGIVHQPPSDTAGTIRGSDIEMTPEELRDEFSQSNNSQAPSSKPSATQISDIDSSPSDLDNETEKLVGDLKRNDDSFQDFFNGDHGEYKSRSETEFAFIIKMLNHGFTKEQIVNTMWASALTKWDEESDNYRKRTVQKAIDYFDGSVTKSSRNGSFSFSDK
jgi:hypothetical protein